MVAAPLGPLMRQASYSPEDTKKLLRHVVEHQKDLVGYYALLTFGGLRPSEGARVQWQDYHFKTNELYVRKGVCGNHLILNAVQMPYTCVAAF